MLLLDAHPVLNAHEIADVARVVAFSLARLHAAGQAHGAVDLQHVTADAAGAVSLLPGPAAGTPADDVRALGDLILELLSSVPPRPGAVAPRPPSSAARLLGWVPARRRRLAGAVPSAEEALAAIARQASPEDGSSPPSAAAIAAQVALRVPTACPPGRRPPSPPCALGETAAVDVPVPVAASPSSRIVVSRAGAVLAALAVFALVFVALSAVQQRRARPVDVAPLPAALPAASSSLVEGPDGRFSVGTPEDVVVVDDWLCRGSPVPALLRPSTGEVFVFDRWPQADEELSARAVDIVPGARSLQASASAGGGCPSLVAVTPAGPVTVPVEPAP